MPSNHVILCRSLFFPPSILPSIRVFADESVLCIRWPKYWSFSFTINPSSEYSGLISFQMDWLDLLAVQGTLKSLLQRHSSKASILNIFWVRNLYLICLLKIFSQSMTYLFISLTVSFAVQGVASFYSYDFRRQHSGNEMKGKLMQCRRQLGGLSETGFASQPGLPFWLSW